MGVELDVVVAGVVGSRRLQPSEFIESLNEDEAMASVCAGTNVGVDVEKGAQGKVDRLLKANPMLVIDCCLVSA